MGILVSQFLRAVGAQAVAAIFAALLANLNILHVPAVYAAAVGAALHALEEYITGRLRVKGAENANPPASVTPTNSH